MKRPSPIAVCLIALAAAYAAHVLRRYGGATIDDAGITFAYADDLAHGHGLRLTPAAAPVEGFSNFLEVLLLAPAARLTARLDAVAKALNVLAVALALLALGRLLERRLPGPWRALALAPLLFPYAWPGWSAWIATGLEGGLLAGLQIASLLLVARPAAPSIDGGLGVVAGLLAWTRPEAIVYGALAVAPRVAARRWRAPAILALLVSALVVTRLLVFRDVVPNTFWAKVNVYNDRMAGLRYVAAFLRQRSCYFLTPLPLLALAHRPLRGPALVAFGQLLWAFAFPVVVGGDWMREYRFMQAAMGPLAALCTFGLVALVAEVPPRLRLPAAAVAVVPLLAAAIVVELRGTGARIAGDRDVDMKRLQGVAASYRRLGGWVRLPDPPLVAEVDVGGLSYRSGLEVLDLTGLADRVTAGAFAGHPARLCDYLFGERRPDLLHLHGSWFVATPVHALSPAYRDYRALADPALDALGIKGLTAVRGDLLDPPSAPVQALAPLTVADGKALLLGLTAIPVAGEVVLAAHARQVAGGPVPPLSWRARDGRHATAPWHAGIAVEPGPLDGALVALAHFPADALPLALEGTTVRLEAWPRADPEPHTLAELTRVPLVRLAGAPAPSCDPARFLDPAAGAPSRARGVAFIARLCRGLPAPLRRPWTDAVVAAARAARDPDDRYDAATAAPPIGLPQTAALRALIDNARAAHQPYDEVLTILASDRLGRRQPGDVRLALHLLLAARQYEAVVLRALAGDTDDREALCPAVRALGLRAAPCPDPPVVLPRVVRQSFEDPGDPSLAFEGSARGWIRDGARRDEERLGGGQGRSFVDTFYGPPGDGALTWTPGPRRASGRTFGALVAGSRDPGLYVAVEARQDGRWVEVARLPPPSSPVVMKPQRIALPDTHGAELRVRVVDRCPTGRLMVDALTFVAEQ